MEDDKTADIDLSDFRNRKRLANISEALKRLEKRASKYLELYVKTEDWKIFKDGFLHLNHYFRPEDLVEIKTCALGDGVTSALAPGSQKIVICSNKIADQKEFNTNMTYNLTVLYDNIRANIDPTNCKQQACVHIRAAHLAKICKAGEKDCFRNITNQNVYNTEVCRGKQEDTFETAYRNCVKDISPINTVKLTSNLGS